MLLVYSDPITPRLSYTFQLFFTSLMGTGYRLTQDRQEFIEYPGPRLSYGQAPLSDEIFQQSSGLLFEEGIRAHEPGMHVSGKGFYPVSGDSMFGFDLFSAAFYLVSRYEEYCPFSPDRHGRYRAEDSFAFRNGFLDKPLVNSWAEDMKQVLVQRYPNLEFRQNTFEFISTFDIDVAFAYRERPLFRTAGGYLKALLRGDFKEMGERASVLSGLPDPYDTFGEMRKMQKEYAYRQITFFLLANYGKHDKNIDVESSEVLRQTIRAVSNFSDTGIHPSYRSCSEPAALSLEIGRLEKLLNKPVRKSRQHFLKLGFPGTYAGLISHGIREDYTMGYASACGFRAGICSPFRFYDLVAETGTELLIYPFQVMDGTLKDYMKLPPAEAIAKAKAMIDEVRNVKGLFVLLWHNHSLSDRGEWEGWVDVYKSIVQYACVKK